jgi:hypothetical protein
MRGNFKHGHILNGIRTKTYRVWQAMMERCRSQKNYVDRGIRVCKRWLKFENFLADMGETPAGLTLERKNNSGNYSPSNCRWASRKEQQRNRRANHYMRFRGTRLSVAEWAERIRMNPVTLVHRLRRGWSVRRSLTEPTMAQYRRR